LLQTTYTKLASIFGDENVTICADDRIFITSRNDEVTNSIWIYQYTYISQPAKGWPPTVCEVDDKKETKYQYVRINEKSINKMQLLQKNEFDKEFGRKNAEFGAKYLKRLRDEESTTKSCWGRRI
jgi:hypothetical protein